MSAVRVLQVVVGGKNFNGIVSFLYQYYKKIDHDKVCFDFLTVRENPFESIKDDPIFAGSKFYTLNAVKPNNRTDHLKMMRGLGSVLEKNSYDAVHINTMVIGAQAPLIYVCKNHHVKTVISHSHNEYSTTISTSKLLAHKLFRSYVTNNADHLFACSLKAGECLFGKEGVALSKFKIINNAIDLDLFGFSQETRNCVRDEFGIPKETVIVGQVGRLSKQKNNGFAIDVFADYHRKKPDSQFWIVGQGDDREMLEEKVKALGMSDSIVFLGQRSNVNELLTAMDVLLFPSLWEGLSVALVEAQASGIPVLASQNITRETAVTELVRFESLDSDISEWSKSLDELGSKRSNRRDRRDDLRKSGFDVETEAKKLENFYCDLA